MWILATICVAGAASAWAGPSGPERGTYAHLEAAFELPQLTGNPFDYTLNDVMVQFACPGGRTVSVPAFYDGGNTWRVRYTPALAGQYTVQQVTLNGKPVERAKPSPGEFQVTGAPGPGFVRIDPANKMRFVFDGGQRYYPLGYNLGWTSGRSAGLPESLAGMGQNGGNWARIWMCHFSQSMNLDWTPGSAIPAGSLSLDVARRWPPFARVHAGLLR